MAETPVQQHGDGGAPAERSARPSWRALLPVAGLGVGLVLLVAGIIARLGQAPKTDAAKPLTDARVLLDEHKYKEAIDLLNGPALRAAESGTRADRAELYRLRARAVSEGQQALGQDLDANNRTIAGDYRRAEELGAELTPAEVYQLARAQLALGDPKNEAAARARALPPSSAELRRRLVKLIIEHELVSRTGGRAEPGGAGLGLLSEMLADPALSAEDRAWAVARQAEIQIAGGHAPEAITRLLREIQQVHAAPADQRAELHTLLARAYLAVGEDAKARENLDGAADLADRLSPLRAEIGVLSGLLHEREPADADGARGLAAACERYQEVLADHPNSVHAAAARFGLARVEAALALQPGSSGEHGSDVRAAELFATVLDDVKAGRAGPDVTRDLVRESLVAAAQRCLDRDRTEAAASYATQAESLDDAGRVPADVLLLKGRACRRLAEERLAAAGANEDPGWIRRADPVTREEIKGPFLQAADAYRAHAALVRGGDNAQFVTSMWEAADCADLAGDAAGAQRAFSDYIDQVPDTDQRKAEATWRLARTFQAERQFVAAAAHYRRLVDARLRGPGAPPEAGAADPVGRPDPWGDRSIVPLAQCLLRDADDTNDAEAEDLLRAAVAGRTLSSRATEFRDALIELGRLRYTQGRYGGADGAIALLRQAADRYPDDPESEAILYMLGDSYRLSAAEMGREIESEAMPQSEKEARRSERRDRLAEAMDLFARVRRDLESRDAARLTDLQRVHLRNASFYLGDTAFDLGEYDPAEYSRAIEFYETARQKYADDPACLVALVQIASAYVALGRFDEAAAANARARKQLDALPSSVWNDPTLPMERRHWERWLDASAKLDRQAAAGPQ